MSAVALYARETAGYGRRLSETLERLRLAAQGHPGHIVQATSLGAEDMVVTDLIARHGLPIAIGTLQTGALHAETTALIDRIALHYGLAVEVHRPDPDAVTAFVAQHGELPMRRSLELRKACCALSMRWSARSFAALNPQRCSSGTMSTTTSPMARISPA